jgi:hypothetical protein
MRHVGATYLIGDEYPFVWTNPLTTKGRLTNLPIPDSRPRAAPVRGRTQFLARVGQDRTSYIEELEPLSLTKFSSRIYNKIRPVSLSNSVHSTISYIFEAYFECFRFGMV